MSDDSISRHAVIDLVEELETQRLKGDIDLLYAPMIKGVRALPSAQPVRKTGQWIKRKKGAIGYNCSCCGKSDISNHFDYCPNCGADMRGEQDG